MSSGVRNMRGRDSSRDIALRQAGQRNVRADLMPALGGVEAGGVGAGLPCSIGGMFARTIGTAFDFEFGSSRGSKEKSVLTAGNAPPQ